MFDYLRVAWWFEGLMVKWVVIMIRSLNEFVLEFALASKIDKLWTVDANSGASGNQLKGETCTKQNNDAISKDGHVLIVVYIKRT